MSPERHRGPLKRCHHGPFNASGAGETPEPVVRILSAGRWAPTPSGLVGTGRASNEFASVAGPVGPTLNDEVTCAGKF